MEQSLPTVRKTVPLKAVPLAALPAEAAKSPYRPELTWEALPVEATELPALDASLRQVNIYNFQNFASC
jgi:hypothetical protein